MGLFITLEGPEGSGKSTQLASLAQYMDETGIEYVLTREPGGTDIGEQIRQILLDTKNREMTPEAEVLLYSAARAQHVRQKISPALERGAVVISDRFAESTLAYQGYGRGLDIRSLWQITEFATGGIMPDLVIYLDIDVRIGLARKKSDEAAGKDKLNRLDQEKLDFHTRVRQGYLEMAQADPERWLILDAQQSIGHTTEQIIQRIKQLLAPHSKV